MKFKHYFLIFSLLLLTQAKKCSSTPPRVEPPPSSVEDKKKLFLPLDNNQSSPNSGSGPNGSTIFAYPNMGGSKYFDPRCVLRITDIASIRIKIIYYVLDASGAIQEAIYSDKLYTQNDIVINGNAAPELEIDAPETGYFFVHVEYSFQNCDNCCGTPYTANTGVQGCNPNQNNFMQYEGKPKIIAETDFSNYSSFISGNWVKYDFICVCDCR
jgi:hypothetical protein